MFWFCFVFFLLRFNFVLFWFHFIISFLFCFFFRGEGWAGGGGEVPVNQCAVTLNYVFVIKS